MMRIVAIDGLALLTVMLLLYGACRLLSGGRPSTDVDVAVPAELEDEGGAVARRARRGTSRASESPTSVRAHRASFLELERRAAQLSPAELESELAELDDRMEQEAWIERANLDELTEAEREELAFLLRQRNALASVRAHRRVAALDHDGEL